MKSFEIKITGNAKSLVDSIKSSQSAMDALIKGIDKADKKLEVLTQTGKHLSNIDKQLAKLKTDYPDIFEKIFPNIDSQINESMKPILQMPELVEQTMTKVAQKMKAIDSGTLKATDDDIKELGNDMRILGETLHLENLDMSFLDGTAKAETKIKRLIDVMGRLVEAYYNVNMATTNVNMGEVVTNKKEPKKSKNKDKQELTVDTLRKKVEEIKDLSKKSFDDDEAFDLMDKKIQSLIKMFKVSDDIAAKLDEELQNVDNSIEETMSKLEKLLGNKFPKAMGNAADAADDASEKIQKLLPTSEGLEKLRIIPDGDQKARISEYAEEYRVILKLLEKGNIESKETVQALRERARTLKNIIKDVNPGDTTLDKLLTDGYGISKGTADTVASPKLSSKFKIDEFKSEDINNESRQKAIDLIHQEIVAENQLAQKKKEELEDAKIKAKENEKARIAAEAEAKAAKEAAEAARLQAEEKERARLAAEAEAKAAHNQSNASSNNKTLLYRYGRTDFFDKDFAYSDTMGEIVDSLKIGFGGFGDGMYSVVGSAVKDIVQSMTNQTDSNHDYFEIDASKYKLFINQTEEEAERLQSFLMNLQKFVLSAGDFRGFDDDIANIDNNSLFNEAKSIFKQFDMKQDEFDNWIQQMKQIVVDNKLDSKGKFNTEDTAFLRSHNFGTRFMQKLGYEGVVNKTGNVEFDGMAQGSVIFDPNYEEIIKYLEETGNKSKWAADLLKLFKQEVVEATSSAENVGAPNSSIEGLDDGVEKAQRTLEEFRALQDEILGKSASAEGGSMDGEAIGRYTERVEAAKAKLDELAKQSLLTADQIKEANDIYETAIGNLEGKSRTNNEHIEDLEGREQVGSYDSGYDRGYYDARSEADSELDNLRKQLNEADAELNRAKASMNSGTPIDISTELQSLENLRTKLEEVKNTIISKNKAFNDEGIIVGQVVGKEVKSLDLLLNKINDITNAINTKTESFQIKGNTVYESVKQAEKPKEATALQKESFNDLLAFQKKYYDAQKALANGVGTVREEELVRKATEAEDLYNKKKQEVKLTQEQENQLLEKQAELERELAGVRADKETTSAAVTAKAKQNGILNAINQEVLKSYKSTGISVLDDVPEELTDTKTAYDALIDKINDYKSKGVALSDDIISSLKEEAKAIKAVMDAYAEKMKKQAKLDAKQNSENQKPAYKNSAMNSLQKKYFQSYSIATGEEFAISPSVISAAEKLKSTWEELNRLNKEIGNTKPTEAQEIAFNRLTDEFNQAKKELDGIINSTRKLSEKSLGTFNLFDAEGKSEFDLTDIEDRKRALLEAVNILSEGKAKIGEFDATYKELSYTVKNANGDLVDMKASINAAGTAIEVVAGKTKSNTSAIGQFIDQLKNKFKSIAQYLISMAGYQEIIQQIRKGIQYVKEIDYALTELKKVTDETDETYAKFLKTMSQTGAEVGATVKDLTNMAANWARLGYSIQEAGELAKSTAVLLNVSEFTDADTASEALISTIQAYGYAAEDSMHVVDVLNEIGNNFAISSDGLATALQDSASSLMAAGNNLEQSVAMVAAANKVLQDPNSVGAALRTISLRIRGTSVKV